MTVLYFLFICILLYPRTEFKPDKLNKKIISFTESSDREYLKLIGGDFDFLGTLPNDIDTNDQYKQLKLKVFDEVLILCLNPPNNHTKARYGKILSEIQNVELRYYNPDCAKDLKIRGRIQKSLQGLDQILIYQKVKSKTYKAIETCITDSLCQLYLRIWDSLWNGSTVLNGTEKSDLKNSYNNFR